MPEIFSLKADCLMDDTIAEISLKSNSLAISLASGFFPALPDLFREMGIFKGKERVGAVVGLGPLPRQDLFSPFARD
jgi:hypothetical protein